MTEQEKIDFLEKVKGHKIRRIQWPEHWFFIPGGLDVFDPNKFFGVDEKGNTDSWDIEGGFGTWQFLEKKESLNKKPSECPPHKWKLTQGIFKTYKDCEICNKKWEDV
jgi:hypothetical protein